MTPDDVVQFVVTAFGMGLGFGVAVLLGTPNN